jgi:hypothetical protein
VRHSPVIDGDSLRRDRKGAVMGLCTSRKARPRRLERKRRSGSVCEAY